MEVTASASPKLIAYVVGYRRHARCNIFFSPQNNIIESLTIKSHSRVKIERRDVECGWRDAAVCAVDCLPSEAGGERERENGCSVTLAGWPGLSTMCSLVAQWKIVGGTCRLAHCPAGGLQPGGDPVCYNITYNIGLKRWHEGDLCPPILTMKWL